MPGDRKGVVFDVDGTLVDTNYFHVVAWWRAFRYAGHTHVTMAELHRTVGQGSDKFVKSVLGKDDDGVREAHSDFYGQWLRQAQAFDGAGDVLRATAKLGLVVALATSSSEKESNLLADVIGAGDAVSAITNSGDVEATKPEPDIVQAALDKTGLDAGSCLFVGDTIWDVEAAQRAGVKCLAVGSGGIGVDALKDAGAIAVYTDVAELLERLDDSPIADLARRD